MCAKLSAKVRDMQLKGGRYVTGSQGVKGFENLKQNGVGGGGFHSGFSDALMI